MAVCFLPPENYAKIKKPIIQPQENLSMVTNNDDSNLSLYLKAMQELKEDDFSKSVLKPLFESMSFSRVDFVGGPYEYGKDLIALHEIPLKGTSIYAIQSKKIGEKSNTHEKSILSDLITQLRQCFTKKIKLHDGLEQLPDHVYLATPFQISQRLLNEIHEQLCLGDKTVEIIDGPKVIGLIKKYKPSLLESLLSISDKLQLHDAEQLNNLELISALNQKNSIDELNCYSDLAFFMGTIDSNILLDSTFSIKKDNFILSKGSWDLFNKEVCHPLEKIIGYYPLTQASHEIDDNYKKELLKFKSKTNTKIKENINQAHQLISTNIQAIKGIISSIDSSINGFIANKKKENPLLPLIIECHQFLKNLMTSSLEKNTQDEIETFTTEKNIIKIAEQHKQSIFPEFLNAKKAIERIVIQKVELAALQSEYLDEPQIYLSFSHEKIERWIESKCHAYKQGVSDINKNKECVDIESFLTDTQKTLNALDILINKAEDNKKYISITKKPEKYSDGLSISPFELFDSRYDIAVFGGAGAGKTTTLQMYVKKLIKDPASKVIYIPLNRYINKVNVVLDDKTKNYDILLSIILIAKNLEPNQDNILSIKSYFTDETRLKLVLDGLDEAYAKYPGIVDSINEFKTRHPSIQILISSRDCVSYLSKVSFLGITLLPFSAPQLYKFISSWFENKDAELGCRVIESIKGKEIAEIVKTPLLATLLCDLAEKGIDIPRSESEIFTKRLELFCGVYDTYKDIRRTTMSQSILQKAAIKIAYSLHSRNLRSASKKDIIKYLVSDSSFNYDDNTCTVAVEELIDPCNILVLDTISGSYSFGHLRYQEHLTSLELSHNRSIEIVHYLKNDWWRGTLCLYAQNCEFYSLIEEFTIKYYNIESAVITLKEMTKYRPKKEQINLLHLISQYEKSDDDFYHDNETEWNNDEPWIDNFNHFH